MREGESERRREDKKETRMREGEREGRKGEREPSDPPFQPYEQC